MFWATPGYKGRKRIYLLNYSSCCDGETEREREPVSREFQDPVIIHDPKFSPVRWPWPLHVVLDLSVRISVLFSKLTCLPQVILSNLLLGEELDSFTLSLIFLIQWPFKPVLFSSCGQWWVLSKGQGDIVPGEAFCRCHRDYFHRLWFLTASTPTPLILFTISFQTFSETQL